MSAGGNTDLGMLVCDTPVMFGKDIQTEFKIKLGKIDLIWRRTDLDLSHLEEDARNAYRDNRFYLSFVYEENGLQMIDMAIDYKVFKYLLSTEEGYYRSHSGNSVEEYAINTFYRKILQVRKESYDNMKVRFNQVRQEGLLNLEMELYQMNSLLFGGKTRVKIEKAE